MPKLRKPVLDFLQEIGDKSGCHQMPERSFQIWGYTFPVCARCTGVVAGQILAVLLFLFGVRCPWYAAIGLLAVMGADWGIQRIGIRESTNTRRFLTGICGGFGLFCIYIFILVWLYHLVINIF